MKTRSDAERFRVPLDAGRFRKFKRKFKEHFSKTETTLRYRILAPLGAVAMAAVSIWILAANVAQHVLMALLMIPSAAVIAVTAAALFQKNRLVRVQFHSSACVAALLELMSNVIFVRGGQDLLLHAIFGGITVFAAFFGIWRWGTVWVNMLAKDGWLEKQNGRSPAPYLLISSVVVPLVRACSEGAGRNALYVPMIIAMSVMCALLGYAIGISVGNIRFMHWLDSKPEKD